MLPSLRSSLLLLSFAPLVLRAQVFAGNATGLEHTSVGIVLVPAMDPFPMSSSDTASIDLQGDGSRDLYFDSGNIHAFDADGSYNSVAMLHAGVEVAVDMPGGYVAKRLDLSDPVDGTLNWRAFDAGGGNSMTLASMLTNFIGQWVTTGGAEWLVDGPVATQGYLAVRVVESTDTLYGWVNLISYVSQDSAWLQIDDFAIETLTTGIMDAHTGDVITATFTTNGMLLLQGDVSDVREIILRDASGRIVRQLSGSSPYALDIAGEAKGTYILTVIERSRTRSFNLVR